MKYKIIPNKLSGADFQSLRAESGLAPMDDEMLEAALSKSIFTLSAVYGDEIIGMLRVVGDGVFVFLIYDMLVHPNYRRLGVGSALVNNALARVLRYVKTGNWVTVSLFASKGKEPFYEKLGFVASPNSAQGAGMQIFIKR